MAAGLMGSGGGGGITIGTTGAGAATGAATGAGGVALGLVCLATFFLTFGDSCLGVGSGVATGAGAGSGAATGADGVSATVSIWAGGATGVGSFLVAQADKVKADKMSTSGSVIWSDFDMQYSGNWVDDLIPGRIFP